MKKILIFILLAFSINVTATSKETTFTNEIFEKSQLEGKTIVIHSWNKTCTTCAKQVKILDKAKQDFKDVIFLSFEQTKDKKIAKFLGIDYWTTIVVYKDNKEISRTIGQTNKEEIYSQIISLH
ncbi:thioredoxin family protein [Candidatus Pelagibacter sp.]|jgi:thiol-disulfide isomerase/thioredoxin|nr:thioredoxin family protein [Candidatus Pelagibacter sp.]|tara:strand:- start:245 stop:616 length:372 start_codon:yes stop_codon:yes gene_type:complete